MGSSLLATRSVTLDVNGYAKDAALAGVVLMIESISGGTPISIIWLDNGGQRNGKIENAIAGRRYSAGGDFSGLEFQGGAGETVTFLVGPAGSESTSDTAVVGSVTVTNEVEIKNAAGVPITVTEVNAAAHANAKKTAMNVSTQALAANANRKYLSMQNPSDTEYVYFRTDGAAAVADATAHKLYPGQSYEPRIPPSGAITIIRGGAVNVDITVTEA